MAKNPNKKVKFQVRVCHTFTFGCNLAKKRQGLTGSDLHFHLFSRNIGIFVELGEFFPIVWDQFHT